MSGDNSWDVKDVMDYFGEEIKDEELAKEIMKQVDKKMGTNTYFAKMNMVRDVLKIMGFTPLFRSVYRRAK